MSDSTRYPLAFIPHHRSPESPGEDPILFAFRGRDLLVTGDLGLPSVTEIDAHGIEAVRTQYLGQLGGGTAIPRSSPTMQRRRMASALRTSACSSERSTK